MQGQIQSARQARKMIRLIRNQLLSPTPEMFSTCASSLGEAIAALGRMEGELLSGADQPDAAQACIQACILGGELQSLRRELSEVNALLHAAGSFYEGYGRLIGAS